MFTVNATLTMLLVGTLIPILVGLITKANAPAAVKSICMIVLSAIGAAFVVSTQADGTAVFSKETIVATLNTIVQAVATYYGVWKPSGVSGKVINATARFGLGGSAAKAA